MRDLLRDGKALFLACDQGFEHGPQDFDEDNVDPKLILELAEHGPFTGVILLPGTAEKYYPGYRVPLIVKLNSKTSRQKGDPRSLQHCSVRRAHAAGATAVGYTIYPFSSFDTEMYSELGRIIEEAHDLGMSVVVWAYPRGEAVPDDLDTNTIAYSARIAAELGADFIKLKYNHDREGFPWIRKHALRTKLLVSGGKKTDEFGELTALREAHERGADGFAIGRNVWQNAKPWAMSEALGQMLFEGKSAEDAFRHYERRDA